MTNPTPQPAKERLEEILDREFPKGKCKERGGALMLFAEAMILLKEERTATLREVIEEVNVKEQRVPIRASNRNLNEWQEGYNQALEDVRLEIQHKLTSE